MVFSKSNAEVFHTLAKTGSGRACVNYDGTGLEVKYNINTNEGEYFLQNILSVGKNMYIIQDENNMVKTKLSPEIIGQFLSNRNATPDHKKFLQAFVDTKFAIYSVTYTLFFFLTECTGQLENATLLVCKSPKTGKPIVKVLYANITLIVLLEIERQKYSKEVATIYIGILQIYSLVLLLWGVTLTIRLLTVLFLLFF